MGYVWNPITGELDRVGQSGGPGGSSPWSTISDTVAASSTRVVDTISLSNFNSSIYEITIYNTTQSVARTFKLVVNNANGALKDQLTNKVGSSINYDIDAISSGGNFELTITNNESYNLSVSIAKLAL